MCLTRKVARLRLVRCVRTSKARTQIRGPRYLACGKGCPQQSGRDAIKGPFQRSGLTGVASKVARSPTLRPGFFRSVSGVAETPTFAALEAAWRPRLKCSSSPRRGMPPAGATAENQIRTPAPRFFGPRKYERVVLGRYPNAVCDRTSVENFEIIENCIQEFIEPTLNHLTIRTQFL